MKLILLVTLTFGLNISYSQRASLPDELFGFRLGQYKKVVTNELGQPNHTQTLDDGGIVDFYYLSKDSSTYIGFQYDAQKKEEIFAIQVSGKTMSRPFYGLSLGDDENKLISLFGKPDTLLTQEFYQKKSAIWKYKKLNLSVLFTGKRISSIRIWDEYKKPANNLPSLTKLLEIIKTNNKSKIAGILSPQLEITYCDNIITWKNSFQKDLYIEKTSVLDFIMNEQFGLTTLIGKKNLVSNLSLRLVEGVGAFPVYKFPKEPFIKEIVLNYQQGKYKIWEIKYKCEK